MKAGNQILIILLTCSLVSCKDNGTNQQIPTPLRALSLSASVNNVAAPVDIAFTGTFHAYSDTMRMYVPDMFLVVAPGRTLIHYALPDTSVLARRTYTYVQHFSSAGTYTIYMLLQTMQGDIFSDTVAIIVR
jgi:hypothetical protein